MAITISSPDGQVALKKDAFTYQQPLQAKIKTGTVYDMELDPSGTFMMLGSSNGLEIINIDPSKYTTNPLIDTDGDGILDGPLNPDDLLKPIAFDDSKYSDDRIIAQVSIPGGKATGVKGFFERQTDRVFVAGGDGSLSIVAFNAGNVDQATIVRTLELPTDFARGVDARNNGACRDRSYRYLCS